MWLICSHGPDGNNRTVVALVYCICLGRISPTAHHSASSHHGTKQHAVHHASAKSSPASRTSAHCASHQSRHGRSCSNASDLGCNVCCNKICLCSNRDNPVWDK